MPQPSIEAMPLVAHLIYRLDFGGLETLLAERINRAARYRHAVICLDDVNPLFAKKITRPGTTVHALHKAAGLSPATHLRLWTLLRRLRPAVFHSYNLSAIEYGLAALLAGVPVRINGAHGRDALDPEGRNRKHNLLRRAMTPFYHCCYANSRAMFDWNRDVIGVPDARSRLLGNGIDTEKFYPRAIVNEAVADAIDHVGAGAGAIVIGTVGRVQAVKDHATLLAAFVLLRQRLPQLASRLRLAIIGDGPLLAALRAQADAASLHDAVWLPGARDDIAAILRGFTIFAMSSMAEGTPGAALEAMASGLPVVGTRVGGLPEAIADGVTGLLVPPGDAQALAAALERYVLAPALAASHGMAARERVLRHYGMEAMVAAYQAMYDEMREHTAKAVRTCAE